MHWFLAFLLEITLHWISLLPRTFKKSSRWSLTLNHRHQDVICYDSIITQSPINVPQAYNLYLTENVFQWEKFSFPDVQERTGGLRKFWRVALVLTIPLPLSDIYGTILINYQVYNTDSLLHGRTTLTVHGSSCSKLDRRDFCSK